MQSVRTVGLLLAAGAGTRFDPEHPGRKLSALVDGVTVAERALSALDGAVEAVIVATRNSDGPVNATATARGAHVVTPPDAALGMGHSLAAAALEAQKQFPDAGWYVVALADMPWVKSPTIAALLEIAMREDRITQPRHAGQRGHPVVFPARYGVALAQCSGDVGARDILRSRADEVCLVDVEDAGVLRDVDTPGDLPKPLSAPSARGQ